MRKWSLGFRIWHWIHALVIFGLLGTVFLRKTFLSWRANSEILMDKLASMQLEISADQAAVLAKAVRAPMWEWHILLGYALAVLLVVRLFLFFTRSGKQNFVDISSAGIHKKMVKIGYIGIYSILAFMMFTGLSIHFYEELGLLKTTASSIKELHEFVFNLVWIFVLMHIGGVVIADSRDEEGIVSAMISGGKVE